MTISSSGKKERLFAPNLSLWRERIMHLAINPLTGEKINNSQRVVFDEQMMSYVFLGKGERLLTHPVTSERTKVKGKHKLVFNWREGRFIFLPKGKRLLENPFDSAKVHIGNRLAFDPLKGQYLVLQKNQRLRFNAKSGEFVVEKKKMVFG